MEFTPEQYEQFMADVEKPLTPLQKKRQKKLFEVANRIQLEKRADGASCGTTIAFAVLALIVVITSFFADYQCNL